MDRFDFMMGVDNYLYNEKGKERWLVEASEHLMAFGAMPTFGAGVEISLFCTLSPFKDMIFFTCPFSYRIMQQRQSIGIVTRYIARPFSTKRALSKPLITPKQNEAIERNQDILSSYMVPGKLKKFFKTRPTRSQAILEENVSSTMNRIESGRNRHI
jgi:hypothetical protein